MVQGRERHWGQKCRSFGKEKEVKPFPSESCLQGKSASTLLQQKEASFSVFHTQRQRLEQLCV